jgi:hypothetical protein
MKVLRDFYDEKVIVLVDEHDAPVQLIHGHISFEDSADNSQLMKSIKFLGETISTFLGDMAKSNPNLEKFLMFGISDAIISYKHSGFNNLKTYQVMDTTYSKFFGIDKEEISHIVEKVFVGIEPKDKENIMSNIKHYYNGYYFKPGKELYSIYSTIQYLDECYVAYYDEFRSIEKDGRWIPEPSSFWPKTSADETILKTLAMPFDWNFHIFLYNVYHGHSEYYKDYSHKKDKNFAAMLENPAGSDQRGKISFYLLLKGGYLTRAEKKNREELKDKENVNKTYFKIPNKEIKDHFGRMLEKYREQLSLDKKAMSALLKATIQEDIFTLGREMTKSLHSLTLKRIGKIAHPNNKTYDVLEKEIQNLLFMYLKDLEDSGKYTVITEHGADHGDNGFRIDIHLKPAKGDCKNHYLIEVKRYEKDDEGIYIEAIEGIAQMFNKTYNRRELHSKEITGIIMMGLAVQNDKICLISQKLTVHNNIIVDLGTIRIQKFWINDKSGKGIKVDYDEPLMREIGRPPIEPPQQNVTDEDHNREMKSQLGEYMAKKCSEWVGELKKQTENNKEQVNGGNYVE